MKIRITIEVPDDCKCQMTDCSQPAIDDVSSPTPITPDSPPAYDTKETLLYSIKSSETDVVKFLKDDNYWVFMDGIHPTDLDNDRVTQYVSKRPEGVIMVTLDGEDGDFMGGSLNSRTELSLNKFFPIERVYRINTTVRASDVTSATFMQFAGRNPKNQGKPIVVLDTFNDWIHLRYRDIEAEQKAGKEWMTRVALAPAKSIQGEWVDLSVEIFVTRSNRGFIRGFVNGKLAAQVVDKPTYWADSTADMKLSFGVYATKSVGDQSMEFSRVDLLELPLLE